MCFCIRLYPSYLNYSLPVFSFLFSLLCFLPFSDFSTVPLTMTFCAAYGCRNRTVKGRVRLYRFPKEKNRRRLWVDRLGRKAFVPTNHSRLCQDHFTNDQFVGTTGGKQRLHPQALPCLFSHRTFSIKFRESPNVRSVKVSPHLDHTYALPTCPQPNLADEDLQVQDQNQTDNGGHDNIMRIDIDQELETGVSGPTVHVDEIPHEDHQLSVELSEWKRKCQDLEVKCQKLQEENERFKSLFREDQLRCLKKGTMRGDEWSKQTTEEALRIRFACGSTGYQLLIDSQFPLPSQRTLRRKTENIKFDCGILPEIMAMLRLKVETLSDLEKDVGIVFDEMSIKPGCDYDTGADKWIGEVNLPKHEGIATHGLVFMVVGISTRIKQVIAYYLTGNSTKGEELGPIVSSLKCQLESTGLRVLFMSSDMGSPNQALWK